MKKSRVIKKASTIYVTQKQRSDEVTQPDLSDIDHDLEQELENLNRNHNEKERYSKVKALDTSTSMMLVTTFKPD